MFRILQSFTIKSLIVLTALAYLEALTLYKKEAASIIRFYANGGWFDYQVTEPQAAHIREAAYWYFVIFSAPIIPLFICVRRKRAQAAIVILSFVGLILALAVTPGGDQKGCDECFIPIFYSVASTVIFSTIAVLWIALEWIFRFFTKRSGSIDQSPPDEQFDD